MNPLTAVVWWVIGTIGSVSPSAGFRLAELAAVVIRRGRINRREVLTVLPHLPPARAAEVVRERDRAMMRQTTLAAIARHGKRDVAFGLLSVDARIPALQPPAILITFHGGPMTMLAFVAKSLPGPVLSVRRNEPPRRGKATRIIHTAGGVEQRAQAFHGAFEHLRSGGFVIIAADVVTGEVIEVPFFEKTIRLARGPFALARLTGAPLVPLVLHWGKAGLETTLGEPIAMSGSGAEGEESAARRAAVWLEQRLLQFPEELSEHVVMAVPGARQQRDRIRRPKGKPRA